MEQNIKKKISCGGFMLGEGLVLSEDGKTLSVSGGGGGGVQPDWNQNDSTAADYVKNRPFYTGALVETVLVEERTVSFVPAEGVYGGKLKSTFVPTVGETYKVSWDGTTYESTCVNFNGRSVIGNLSIMGVGSDTGEPFLAVPGSIGPDTLGIIVYTADTSASHTISISSFTNRIVKIDEKYLPELPYMDKVNPTGTGSYSLNRKADTTVGDCSFSEGCDTTASGNNSHAEGFETSAYGACSHAEGSHTQASAENAHVEGYYTRAHASHQHVQGKYNVEDSSRTYAHIVGNGTSDTARSNAHTLDWSGNAWYAGTVEGKALILPSSTEGSTKKFRITVDDSGALKATEL